MSPSASFHTLNIPSEARHPSPPPYALLKDDLDSLLSFQSAGATLPIEIKLRKPSTYSYERRHSCDSLRSKANFFSLLKPNALTKGPKTPPATGMITKTSVSVVPTGPVFEDPAVATPKRLTEYEHSDSDDLWLADRCKRKAKMRGILSGEEILDGPTNTPMSISVPPSPEENAKSRSMSVAAVDDDTPMTETSSSAYSSHSSAASLAKSPARITRRNLTSPARMKRGSARKVFITAAGLSLVPQDSLDIARKRFAQGRRIYERPRKVSKDSATASITDPARVVGPDRPRFGILRGEGEQPARALSDGDASQRGVHVRIHDERERSVSHHAEG